MRTNNIIVSDLTKKHDNPFAELVQEACKYDSNITLECNGRRINAKSIMGVLAFNPYSGMEVTIVTDGKDEAEAAEAMVHYLECN